MVWSAPRTALGLSIPTATTLPGLVGEFCASLLDDLIGKQIATGLTTSHIQFPDYGGSLLQKAWILLRLPCQGDKAVCGWQAERFQFHAKNPCRKFEQRAKSRTVSMR